MKMNFHKELPIPQEVKQEYPLTDRMTKIKDKRDEEIRAVFDGTSNKFILIIGPCSADHNEPVLEYISRLRKIEDEVSDKIVIIPRIYTNKPRTTGQGYKGMLHQPDPDAKPDMYKGLVAIRELHLAALRDYDFSCADEMLYPENYRYLSDLLSYVAVGARSVENQQHRLTASGMNIPVGMKNPTSGGLSVMLNSIVAAQSSHKFIYRGWEVHSCGNPYAHAILRGFVDNFGRSHPNYHYENLCQLLELYAGKAPLIIELKAANGNAAKLAEAVCNALKTYHGPYGIESFDPRCLLWLKRNRPDVIRGQLSQNFMKNPSGQGRLIDFILTFLLGNLLTKPDFIAYKFEERKNLSNLLCLYLWRMQGASWTITKQENFETCVQEGLLPIFEQFEPKVFFEE